MKERDKIPGIVLLYPGANLSAHTREFCGGGSLNYMLLEKGYAIVLPDCPLDFLSHPGHPIDVMIDALLPQLYAVCRQGQVDIHKLGILGHSYGGYGAAAVISRTHLFRAAAALSGVYDLGEEPMDILTILTLFLAFSGQNTVKEEWEYLLGKAS